MVVSKQRKSFATFLILCPTTFFLGLLFAQLPYDYPILWKGGTPSPPSPEAFNTLEAHLRQLHSSPPVVPRVLHIVIAVGFLGFFIKLYKPSESNTLFDGASLFLYMCGLTVYITNIVKGLRIVQDGLYDAADDNAGVPPGTGPSVPGGEPQLEIIGREDSLKVLAASNTILGLVLVGVLTLQAGQWYAERKDEQDMELRQQQRESSILKKGGAATSAGKKTKIESEDTPRESGLDEAVTGDDDDYDDEEEEGDDDDDDDEEEEEEEEEAEIEVDTSTKKSQ